MNKVLGTIGDKTILNRNTKNCPFVVAHNYDEKTDTWDFGYYFDTFQNACIYALSMLKENTPTDVYSHAFSCNYQIACTAEYLRENYESISKDDAWAWACEVREGMNDDEEYNSFESKYIEALKGRHV